MDAKKKEWKTVEIIEESEGGLAVEIRASSPGRPHYSFVLGRRLQGKTGVSPFVPVWLEGQGRVNIRRDYITERISALVDNALKRIEELAQGQEDDFINQRVAQESRSMAQPQRKKTYTGPRENE